MYRHLPCAPEGDEASIFQESKKLCLNGDWYLRDFVQEESPPLGQADFPQVIFVGIGKSSPFIAEEFAFEKRLGEGSTDARSAIIVSS
jgi:hypothetical protein